MSGTLGFMLGTVLAAVFGLLRIPSLLLLMAQGLFGVLAWNVLIFWFFRYLEAERGYTSGQAMVAMLVAIVAICVTTWLACAALYGVVAYLVPKHVEALRRTVRQRASELQQPR